MEEDFKRYLIRQGYSELTTTGKPSTVQDYTKRIEKICQREKITWRQLADNVANYVQKYDKFGEESEFGSGSHNAFISALKQFEKFVK